MRNASCLLCVQPCRELIEHPVEQRRSMQQECLLEMVGDLRIWTIERTWIQDAHMPIGQAHPKNDIIGHKGANIVGLNRHEKHPLTALTTELEECNTMFQDCPFSPKDVR